MIAALNFYPNRLKRNPKNGKVPIYMRVTFKRSKSECRLNVCLPENELEKWEPIMQRVSAKNNGVNHVLNRIDEKFQDFLLTYTGKM